MGREAVEVAVAVSVSNMPATRRRLHRWRLPVVWILCSSLPLLLFLYLGHRMLSRTSTETLLVQSDAAADTVGKVLEQHLASGLAAVQSIAVDPDFEEAARQHNKDRVLTHLREAHNLRADFGFWEFYDANGLVAVYPLNNDRHSSGENVTATDWFQNALQHNEAYVSGAALVAESNDRMITVAAPVGQPQPIGVLRATYSLSSLKGWLDAIPVRITKWVSVVDRNGFVVVPPNMNPAIAPHDASALEEVKGVLAGHSGNEFVRPRGQRTLVTSHPLSSLRGGVLVEIPETEIEKAFWNAEKPFALVGMVFAVLAMVVGGAFAWLYTRLKRSQEYVRGIISSATDAFVAIDEYGTITDWNPKAEELFGWSAVEAIGSTVHSTIIPERYREAHWNGLRQLRATGRGTVLNQPLELAALDRTGREFPIELCISAVRGYGKNSFTTFLRDVSERKRAQFEIAQLNAELQVRIDALESRNAELEAFSYSVSHDVRAPLRHIEGYAQMLSHECGVEISSAGRDYLKQIENGARRMHQLIDDLLRFARLGEQGLRPQKTSLGELVADVMSSLKPDVGVRKVEFQVAELPTVECDRTLIRQVYWNLMSNAVKFTATRDRAVITIGQQRREDHNVLFVRDNGVGFNMQYADKLFAPFQRLHAQDEFEGTGIGLATVRRIILKHGGDIWAEAEPDGGACFFFSLRALESSNVLAMHT